MTSAPVQPRTFTKPTNQTLDIVLTDEERKAAADRVVGNMAEVQKLEDEFAEVKKEWQKKIKTLKGEINKAAAAYRTGKEFRQVDAEQHYDLDTRKTWVEFRGQRYHETALTDRQVRELQDRPLFPEHDAGDGVDKGVFDPMTDSPDAEFPPAAVEVPVEPLDDLPGAPEGEIADVFAAETRGRGKGKKDHTA